MRSWPTAEKTGLQLRNSSLDGLYSDSIVDLVARLYATSVPLNGRSKALKRPNKADYGTVLAKAVQLLGAPNAAFVEPFRLKFPNFFLDFFIT